MFSTIHHTPKVTAIKAVTANNDTFWTGFQKLLDKQLVEIAAMKESFDYTIFAGKTGPLSGSGCVRPH